MEVRQRTTNSDILFNQDLEDENVWAGICVDDSGVHLSCGYLREGEYAAITITPENFEKYVMMVNEAREVSKNATA